MNETPMPRFGAGDSDDPRRAFRRSSRCGCESNCVEVAYSGPGVIAVRDTKRGPDGPVLSVPASLLTALKRQQRA